MKNFKPFFIVFWVSLAIFMFMAALVITDTRSAELTGQSGLFSVSAVKRFLHACFGYFDRFYYILAGPAARTLSSFLSGLILQCSAVFTLPRRAALFIVEFFNLL